MDNENKHAGRSSFGFCRGVFYCCICLVIAFIFGLIYVVTPTINNDLKSIGNIDTTGWVGHGHITDIGNVTCREGSIINSGSSFYFYDGELYPYSSLSDDEFDDDPDALFINVIHAVNPDNQKEMITTIMGQDVTQEKVKELGIKVPVDIQCQPVEKEIYTLKNASGVAVTPITDICPNGKVVLPDDKWHPISADYYSRYSVSESDDGKLWVITSHGVIYPGGYETNVDDLIEEDVNIPVTLTCQYTPEKKTHLTQGNQRR